MVPGVSGVPAITAAAVASRISERLELELDGPLLSCYFEAKERLDQRCKSPQLFIHILCIYIYIGCTYDLSIFVILCLWLSRLRTMYLQTKPCDLLEYDLAMHNMLTHSTIIYVVMLNYISIIFYY